MGTAHWAFNNAVFMFHCWRNFGAGTENLAKTVVFFATIVRPGLPKFAGACVINYTFNRYEAEVRAMASHCVEPQLFLQ